MNTDIFSPQNKCVTGGFHTFSGLSSHHKETCGLRVRCIPATASGAGSRVTGTVLKYPTRGLPVTNPSTESYHKWLHYLPF